MKINRIQLVLTIIALMGIVNLFSQEKVIVKESDFDKEIKKNTHFPLATSEKKIAWKNTYYFEKFEGYKTINGKEYTIRIEEWESGRVKKAYLREEEGIVYLYEVCCNTETIVVDKKYIRGKSWEKANKKVKYKVMTLAGKLKTPYGNYDDLLVISEKHLRNIYKLYYKKGFGYVGATRKGVLISHVIPTEEKE